MANSRTHIRYAVLVAVLAAVVTAGLTLPLGQWSEQLVAWIREAGMAGVAVYAVVYVLSAVLMLPGSILTLGAGFAYGPIFGTLLVSPVSVVAATLAFLLGRTVARGWVAGRVERDPRFAAIDTAIGRQGFRIVALLRLSPVFPFNVLNYALGLTQVRLRDFVLGSFVGMLPGTFMYVYLGSLVTNVGALTSGGASGGFAQQILYWAGLAATIVVTVVVTRIARRALRESLAAPVAADASRVQA
jgi:uncharacterized membrane protein YdjX (TVP38/TMEM64 family)